MLTIPLLLTCSFFLNFSEIVSCCGVCFLFFYLLICVSYMPFIDVLGLSLVGENNLYSRLPTNRSFKSYRSSRPEVLCKKDVLGNFAKFTGKHLYQSFFFNKVAGQRHRWFPVNFVKFLRTPFLTEHSGGCFCNMSFKSCSKYH